MWFANWYTKNNAYINAFLITAAVLGILSGTSVLLFPAFLSSLATIPLFAFLSSLPATVSSLFVAAMAASVSFTLIGVAALLTRQVLLVSEQVGALFATKPTAEELLPASSSHQLMQPYLRKRASRFKKEADLVDELAALDVDKKPTVAQPEAIESKSLDLAELNPVAASFNSF